MDNNQVLISPWEGGEIPPLELVGGKGYGLYWLAANGFPVPPTWVLTTAVFDMLLHRIGLDRQFQQVRRVVESPRDWDAAQQTLREQRPQLDKMRERLLAAPIPDRVAMRMEKLLLMPVSWAVRSSATVEDNPQQSFAGQFLSFLSVGSGPELWESALRVMGSAFGYEVLSYCVRNRTPIPRMAVIFQEMKPITARDRSGVAFSHSPVPSLSGVLIQVSFGAGETVVDGRGGDLYNVHGDQVAVEPMKTDEIMITGPEGGLISVDPPSGSVLTPDEARHLAEQVLEIAEKWGGPVNVEFIWRADAPLQIVQVRSVTA